jgi:lipid-binding SYLF domain-containing protein
MFNRRITAGLLSGVVAVGLFLSAQTASAIKAQDAAKLDAEAKATLTKFQAGTKGAEEVFASAKGILVCPKITKGGFIVGVESGNCVLTKGAPKPLYYGTSALKAGLLVGLSSYSMILALNTDDAVAKFTKGEREWEMGVDASVAVAKVGAGGALDTTNLKKDIVSFIFGEKGLMGDVSFSGSRFKKNDVE